MSKLMGWLELGIYIATKLTEVEVNEFTDYKSMQSSPFSQIYCHFILFVIKVFCSNISFI